ncbi:MAG: thiamine-phosphate kinase [Nitrososphaerota archaeon]|nr:thiamine-phosphate kinase [Nitrososphaerota archaeon]MDG6929727.1 thiamine-phosphate kinase [Nitrososphaerota archaeon]
MNEIEIINYIRNVFKSSKLNDDVAYLPNKTALKVDMLVGSTDAPPGITFFQIGKKAVASTISDFGVKGVRPVYGLFSYAFPKNLSDKDIKDLINGTKYAVKKYGFKLVGGDVNESDDLIVDCLLLGTYKRQVSRGGAKDGDVIYATGEFGLTKAGLDHLLLHQHLDDRIRALALKQVYNVEPPYSFAVQAIESGYVNSSMDSSDGLAYTLNEMASQSNRSFIIEELPVSKTVYRMLDHSKRNVYDDVMFGGEEYQMVLTAGHDSAPLVEKLAKKNMVTMHKIGHVVNGKPYAFFRDNDQNLKIIPKLGWINLGFHTV